MFSCDDILIETDIYLREHVKIGPHSDRQVYNFL